MKTFVKKAGLGVTLAATALGAAVPANAQYYRGHRHYRHGGGGDVAAGAVLGGILGLGVGAAIAGSNHDRVYDRRYDRGYYGDYRYAPPPPPRAAYYDGGYNYAPRCWIERRYDPYNGYPVRVRVCN